MTTYYYTANGWTDGYDPYVKVEATSTEILRWARKHNLKTYQAVPSDPEQMLRRDGNNMLYRVRHYNVYKQVGREEYYKNKHPFYQRGKDRENLISG